MRPSKLALLSISIQLRPQLTEPYRLCIYLTCQDGVSKNGVAKIVNYFCCCMKDAERCLFFKSFCFRLQFLHTHFLLALLKNYAKIFQTVQIQLSVGWVGKVNCFKQYPAQQYFTHGSRRVCNPPFNAAGLQTRRERCWKTFGQVLIMVSGRRLPSLYLVTTVQVKLF